MVSQIEALRGNERIQQLMEEFPELPRPVVIKADYVRQGVKHTPILDQVGRWALPDVHDMMEYDYDEHSHATEDVAGGHVFTPRAMYMKTGAPLQIMFRSTSPYEVRYEGRGCFWLYRDDAPVEEVHFAPCPQWYRKTTSSGRPMSSVLSHRGEQRLHLIATNYCEYFREGNQCQYCNLNPSAEGLSELGQERVLTKREQDVYETYMACAQEMKVLSTTLTGGAFVNPKKEANHYLRNVKTLRGAMKDSGCEAPISISFQAMDGEDHLRLKEAGVTSISHNLEVWDARLFEIICPGKAKSVGRERWIEALVRGVEIFGRGRAGSNFVLGVELAQPFGFKTEDEAYESNMEGWRYLVSRGVRVGNTPWQNRPGSLLARVEPPRVEYVLRTEIGQHRLMKQHNLLSWAPGQHPSTVGEHSAHGDWADGLPKEAIWPPALRT